MSSSRAKGLNAMTSGSALFWECRVKLIDVSGQPIGLILTSQEIYMATEF